MSKERLSMTHKYREIWEKYYENGPNYPNEEELQFKSPKEQIDEMFEPFIDFEVK